MSLGADLYSILIAYSNKNNSPYIKIDSFLDSLGKNAKKYSADHPAWNKWLQNRDVTFWAELSVLAEEGKCDLIADAGSGQIFMRHYFPEQLSEVYRKADDDADVPFPGEQTLGADFPENQIMHLTPEFNLLTVLSCPDEITAPVLKISFSDDFGSALVPADMIPRQLTEIAILKVRNYLKRYGNKEYVFHKLITPLQGKESFLKDQLDQIIIRPMDTYNSIKDSRELSYLFWAHLCSLAKNELKKKQDRLPADVAAFQSFSIIEEVNGYFKSVAVKRQETELAFRSLENRMTNAPYRYSMGQILKFADARGKLLLGQYTTEELEEWLKKQSSESKNNELPNLLVIRGPGNGEQFFLLKSKMFAYCSQLLADTGNKVTEAVSKQWSKLLLDHKKVPAMEDDDEFEKALARFARNLCPELVLLLQDPKLAVACQEMEKTPGGASAVARIFNKGQLLPFSSIFFINRKDTLQNARLVLPFWYSIPIISTIIAFFKGLSKKKKRHAGQSPDETDGTQELAVEVSAPERIRAAAAGLEFTYIPSGHTTETYMKELEDRWVRLIDTKARRNLIEDVQHLLQDNLRRTLRIEKRFNPTQEKLSQMAYNLVIHNPALSSLGARDSLLLYMEIYMVNLLKNV